MEIISHKVCHCCCWVEMGMDRSTSQLGTRRCIRWNVILTPETITHRVISDCFLICFVIYKSCMWTLILSNYWSVSVKLFIWIECGSKKENTWKNMKIAFIPLNLFFDLPLVWYLLSFEDLFYKLYSFFIFIFYFWYTQKICSYYTKHICPEGNFSLIFIERIWQVLDFTSVYHTALQYFR